MASPLTEQAPSHLDQQANKVGLRAVAALEATKGVLVIVLVVLLLLVHNRIEDYAEDLLYHLHIAFDRNLAQRFLRGASRISDSPVWTVAVVATLYALLRFVEAWGLWNRRVWAEWFALVSGALYLPWELMKAAQHATWEHLALLVSNIVVVAYMLYVRVRDMRSKARLNAAKSAG